MLKILSKVTNSKDVCEIMEKHMVNKEIRVPRVAFAHLNALSHFPQSEARDNLLKKA